MQEMIDIVLYRFRIGINCKKGSADNLKSSPKVSIPGNLSPENKFFKLTKLLSLSIIYVYTIICMLGMTLGMLLECKFRKFSLNHFYNITDMEMINIHLTHIKLLSTILVIFLITRDLIVFKYFGCFIGLVNRLLYTSPSLISKDDSRTKKIVSFMSQSHNVYFEPLLLILC